jgi:hypothetical protein
MKGARSQEPESRMRDFSRCWRLLFFWLLTSGSSLLFTTGCAVIPFHREPPRPGRTTLGSPLVVLPAQPIGNYLLIEAKWDRNGPYHFLVDTGSSVTLVTPALARRYPGKNALVDLPPRVRVAAADGTPTELPSAVIRRIDLGDARFEDVPVLVYDCATLSAHLGVKIDGLLGFPLFRETLLTLDYPGSRIVLQPLHSLAMAPGTIIAFDDSNKTPLIHLHLGDRSVLALIDSGSDATFSLNPAGLDLKYAVAPRPGATIGTLAGDRQQEIGRIGDTIAVGNYLFPLPIVDLTDELSAIGGGALRNFAITFDQEHDRVTFFRDSREPINAPARRSAGVSFNKTAAYWRVVGVVPNSPAQAAGIQTGDLITRINGEPVAAWNLQRYDKLLASTQEVSFTFLNGNVETPKTVSVFELVP